MSDNVGITWATELRSSRHTPTSAADMDDLSHRSLRTDVETRSSRRHEQEEMSQGYNGDYNTQRNTPTALSAHRPAQPVEEDAWHGLEEGSQHGLEISPGFLPLKSHQSLPSSNQTSSNSLKGMGERDADQYSSPSASFLHRALSTTSSLSRKSSHGQLNSRSSHSKSLSSSLSASRRPANEHPIYPDQSFAALQAQFNASRPARPLRSRSSHPAQNLLYNEMSTWTRQIRDRQPAQGTKTADNTPMSSPGLFNSDNRLPSASSLTDISPQLHHLQAPKETHTAEIEHDTFSGNKFINNYEVVQELGRGEHGKVKLARDIEKATLVAVKIVPRYSVKRRLGRLGTPEDRTKREVAILKKARHPNVVSLLEVIDDPNKNKVYLILEYVEKGEIKWRKPGVREVLAVNNNRFIQERLGVEVPLEPTEKDLFYVGQAKRRHEQQERARTSNMPPPPNWSLEHGDEDLDEDDEPLEISRSASRHFYESSNPSRTSSHDEYAESALAGSMYGAYAPDAYRGRKFSIAASTGGASHMSSEWNFDESDDEHSYVPALTLEEARRAFRDTLSGLQFLHFIGIIHRDIKPANLLVASSGTVKISDFGVSYLGRPTSDEDPENKLTEKDVSALDDEVELARSVGTPAFWAPELCLHDPDMFEEKNGPSITGALDLWALGITLYCMVYARLPFYATETMGLHDAICKAEVYLPKTRLVPVDTSRDRPSSQVPSSINCNKRLDYELKFEVVPDPVRDLIRKLLIKDPANRMTIDEAKRHPWVVEGLNDPSQWIKGPELGRENKKKILEVDEKEMSHAVGRRNIIERALNTAGRLAGSLLGRSTARKRAPSAATSASHSSDSIASPSGSSSSTVGRNDREKVREGRRASLRGDEVLGALKTSRENAEHPLAQSQTASPDGSAHDQYFSDPSPSTRLASTGCTPLPDIGNRPAGPDRGISTLSTTESVKTVRASQMQRSPLPLLESPHDVERPFSQDRGFKSRVDGLWEGTAKSWARLASRDRRSQRGDRSPVSSRHSSESDAHAGPSIAVSTASAAGAIELPDALRTAASPIEYNMSPPTSHLMTFGNPKGAFQAPASTQEAFEQAQEVNQRRLIQEVHLEAEAAAEAATRPQNQSPVDECPPSPDDITFLEKHRTKVASEPTSFSLGSAPIQAGPSASTIASSLDGYGTSSVAQSISNPSFGVVSNASSPPVEGFLGTDNTGETIDIPDLSKDAEPAFMRTADTITKHGQPAQIATGRPLEDWQDKSFDHDHQGDDDSDEDGMMMGPSSGKL